jgi:hypothetical protein
MSGKNVFVGKILLLHVRCSPLLSARIFIHTLEDSDSNLFWATIVTANSHQFSFSFGPHLSVSLWSIKNKCDHLVGLQCNNKFFNRCVTITLILQKKSLEDGILLFDQPDFHICCERILLFLRNMFKFLGHTQFLEVCTTSKEIMLFHDNGFVLLRFVRGFN